ncbi:hypothetical protein ACSFC0_25420 [Serratia marcescens]|uniref:hypothetical protein n=1 Tax=Serratia TaxID=613 RepID=UPI0022202111|nr:hypothetical protein [Serratia marcescens]UYU06706.1 hypothetical protein OHY99_25385 [Serratia marcescens]
MILIAEDCSFTALGMRVYLKEKFSYPRRVSIADTLQEVVTTLSKYPVRYVFLGADRVCNEWGQTELRRHVQRYQNTLFFILTEVRCTPINRLLVMADNLVIINRRDIRPVLARIKAGLLYLSHDKSQLRLSDTFYVSRKETRILNLFFRGISHRVICNRLSIENKTLYSHLWNVKRRAYLISLQQLYQIYQIKKIVP